MRGALISLAAALSLTACGADRPTEAEQNLEQRATGPQVPAPADRNAAREGPVTPAEQNNVAEALRNGQAAANQPQPSEEQAAREVVRRFAELLEQKRFAEARRLYGGDGEASGLSDAAFAERFEDFDTISAAIAGPARVEGAAGSLYADVQLTLHGTLENGEPYSRTGLVTVRRVNDVPGATPDQLRWHIVKIQLGAAPQSAAARS